MSIKKGYTYENINEFYEKYKCKLLSTKEEIDNNDSKEFEIRSRCGHKTMTSFTKLLQKRIGIYCNNCFEDYTLDGIECLICNNKFMPTIDKPIFCSEKCSHTRIITEEQKQKTRTTFCKKMNYYDENGNLKDSKEALKIIRLNKQEIKRQENGTGEKHIWTYEMINAEYSKKNCILLTTEQELNNMPKKYFKFTIKSSCGHVTDDSLFGLFIRRGTGIKCKKCTIELMTNNAIINSKENGISKCVMIENTGVNLIREMCKDSFEIIKTRECCEADILVRPKNMQNDNWLKIQLKVTNQSDYTFNLTRNYSNMLVSLIHIIDKKLWLFEPNDIKIGHMFIGKNKSKYDNYKITNIDDSFTYWYNKQIYNATFEEGNMPQSKCAQLEYEFVKHRKNKIKFLNFVDSEIDGLVYDFKINDLKIQEKICTIAKTKIFVSLHKSNGTIDKIQKHKPYYEHDNDFYWFNDKHKKIFYVVPEKELIDRKFISTVDSIGKTQLNIKTNKYWLANYEFDYNTINEELNKNNLLTLLNQPQI